VVIVQVSVELWPNEVCDKGAFKQLKQVFTSRPLLVAPNLDKEFRVKANTSNFATGGVLSIKCKDNKWRPVAYISKSLNETEQNYKIHNKEMLAVIHCLEIWRHFLEGTRSKFEVWTDHKNLEYFMRQSKAQLQTSKMGTVFIKIQLRLETYFRK